MDENSSAKSSNSSKRSSYSSISISSEVSIGSSSEVSIGSSSSADIRNASPRKSSRNSPLNELDQKNNRSFIGIFSQQVRRGEQPLQKPFKNHYTPSFGSYMWNGTKSLFGKLAGPSVWFEPALSAGVIYLAAHGLAEAVGVGGASGELAVSLALSLAPTVSALVGADQLLKNLLMQGGEYYAAVVRNTRQRMWHAEMVGSIAGQVTYYGTRTLCHHYAGNLPNGALDHLQYNSSGYYYHSPNPNNSSQPLVQLNEEGEQLLETLTIGVCIMLGTGMLTLAALQGIFMAYPRADGDFRDGGHNYLPGKVKPNIARGIVGFCASVLAYAGIAYVSTLRSPSATATVGMMVPSIIVRAFVKQMILIVWPGNVPGHSFDLFAAGEVGLTHSAKDQRFSSVMFPMFVESVLTYGPLATAMFVFFPGAVGAHGYDAIPEGNLRAVALQMITNIFGITLVEAWAAGTMAYAMESNANRLGYSPLVGMIKAGWDKGFAQLKYPGLVELEENIRPQMCKLMQNWWVDFCQKNHLDSAQGISVYRQILSNSVFDDANSKIQKLGITRKEFDGYIRTWYKLVHDKVKDNQTQLDEVRVDDGSTDPSEAEPQKKVDEEKIKISKHNLIELSAAMQFKNHQGAVSSTQKQKWWYQLCESEELYSMQKISAYHHKFMHDRYDASEASLYGISNQHFIRMIDEWETLVKQTKKQSNTSKSHVSIKKLSQQIEFLKFFNHTIRSEAIKDWWDRLYENLNLSEITITESWWDSQYKKSGAEAIGIDSASWGKAFKKNKTLLVDWGWKRTWKQLRINVAATLTGCCNPNFMKKYDKNAPFTPYPGETFIAGMACRLVLSGSINGILAQISGLGPLAGSIFALTALGENTLLGVFLIAHGPSRYREYNFQKQQEAELSRTKNQLTTPYKNSEDNGRKDTVVDMQGMLSEETQDDASGEERGMRSWSDLADGKRRQAKSRENGQTTTQKRSATQQKLGKTDKPGENLARNTFYYEDSSLKKDSGDSNDGKTLKGETTSSNSQSDEDAEQGFAEKKTGSQTKKNLRSKDKKNARRREEAEQTQTKFESRSPDGKKSTKEKPEIKNQKRTKALFRSVSGSEPTATKKAKQEHLSEISVIVGVSEGDQSESGTGRETSAEDSDS